MREMTVDWAALHSAFQMNMPEVRCFLSIEDGRVLKLPPGDPSLATVRSDPQHHLAIEAIPSRIQYQWLDDFIKSIENVDVRARMEAAINGKGAFRRFKDILLTLPDERRRWFEYRDQMMRQRIIEWVREVGIVPLNEAPWLSDPDAMASQVGIDGLGPPSVGVPGIPTFPALTSLPGMAAPAARQSLPASDRHDVEAVRDFLIEWSDSHPDKDWTNPLQLEALADEIGRRFLVRTRL